MCNIFIFSFSQKYLDKHLNFNINIYDQRPTLLTCIQGKGLKISFHQTNAMTLRVVHNPYAFWALVSCYVKYR